MEKLPWDEGEIDFGVVIKKSAYKHGISRDDILNVISNPIRVVELETDPKVKWLYIGTGATDRDLEVITVEVYEEFEIVIHASKLTEQYYKYLPKPIFGEGDE